MRFSPASLLVVLALVAPTMAPRRAAAQAGIPYLAPRDEPAKPRPDGAAPGGIPGATGAAAVTGASGASGAAAPAPTPAADLPPPPEPNLGKTFAALAARWNERRGALARGDAREAARLLATLVDEKVAAGWPDVFVFGEALAHEADRATTAGQAATARTLAAAAVSLAPHRPETHFALARATLATGSGVGAALSAAWPGVVAAFGEPPLARAQLGNLVATAVGALLLAALVLALTALYRTGRLFLHDLHHLLPRGATRLQAILLGVSILLVPVFLRLGPLWAVVVWLTALSPYFQSRERRGSALALALLSGFAFGMPLWTAHAGWAGSRSQDLYLTVRDAGAEDAAARLRAQERPLPEELYALGLRARWSGDLATARSLLDKAAGRLNDENLQVTLGNVRFQSGDRPGAVEAYERALRVGDENVAALFNLSRVYYAMMEHGRAGEAQRRAMSLDLERVERLQELAKRTTGTFLVDGEVPHSLLEVRLEPDRAQWRAGAQIWATTGGGTTRLTFALVAGLAAMLVAFGGGLWRTVRPSTLCPRCGQAACRRCNPEMRDQAQCGQCYHAFIDKEDVDPQECIRKEIEVHRFRRRQVRVRQVLSVFVAGWGMMLRGAFLGGLASMAAFFTLLGVVLQAADLLPDLVPAEGPGALALGLAAVGLCAVYVVSLVSGVREEA